MPSWFSSDSFATLLLIIFIFQFKRISSFMNLLKIRLRSAQWSSVEREVMPDYLHQLFDCAEVSLKELGFERINRQAAAPINVVDPRSHVFAEMYWHREQAVIARVEQAEAISGQMTKVQFLSVFTDGKSLLTTNRELWAQLPAPPDIMIADIYADNLPAQWQYHLQMLAQEVAQHRIVMNQEEAFAQQTAFHFSRWAKHMQQAGWVHEEQPNIYRLTARGAWRYTQQLNQITAETRIALARPYHHEPKPEERNVRLAEMDTIGAMIALAAEPTPTWFKTVLFVLTLVASAILFGYDFGLMSAAALLVVLLVHELGHLSAMWLLNYRNLSMLFLPFLGAAATGHKPEASAWQEASVLLAGPVMGLVAAFAVSQIPAEVLPFAAVEFARSFVLFGVILNLFNLIPAGILDGGRLFELAVLGRFPYARAVFSSIGMGVGLVYAIWTRSIVFGVVMGLLMFGIPLQFKAARIIATIRQKNKKMLNQALTPELALQALGQEFANGDYGNTGSKQWSGRVNIARLAYPRLLQGIPRLSASIGIFLTHLSVIIATLIVVVLFGWRHPAPIMSSTKADQSEIDQKYSVAAKAAQDAFVTRYTAEHDPVKKWAMLDQQEEDDIEPIDSTWQNQQRVMLLDQLPNDHEGKLRYQLNESPKVEANLLNIINQLTLSNTRQVLDLDEGKFALLVDVYSLLAQEASVEVISHHAPMVEKLWLTLNSTNHVYREYRSQLALISAHIASRQGEIDTAKTWMTRYQETGGERAHYISAWFLLDIGHAEQALDLAKEALALPLPPNTNAFTQRNARTQWQTLAGWAEMALGHPQLADSYFQAVLAQREQQREANRQDQPWWIRLLARSMESNTLKHKWLNEEVLDHVVALHATNPSAARDLFNSLNKQRLPYLDGTVEGWGKARALAFKQILIQFNIPEKNGAGL